MTTYRTGNHHGVTIVAEPTGDPEMFCCNRDDHDHARGRLVAVVVNGDRELAERICALLNLPDAPEARELVALIDLAELNRRAAEHTEVCR